MLNKETRKKIDNCRNILVGVLPLPTDQVELITIALIYKFMDDMDEQSLQLGGNPAFFRNGLKEFSWQNLMSNQLGGNERVQLFVNALEEFAKAPHLLEFFKSIFRNTFLKFRDGRVFKLFLDEINYFSYNNSEELGNAFEYLLNTMGTQGENGQFRTPRNIIDFIVEVVDPDKDDKILDPACGTAGFLISAYKHILRKYTTGYENYRISLNNQTLESNGIHWGDKLLAAQKSKLSKRIEGYDNTPLMVRLSQVNMYLHNFPNPAIYDYDTLTYTNRWNDKYDCILANPPFMSPKGGVKPNDQFRIRANKTEVLFSDYIIEHLTPNGKAGWIVPEGIIFTNSNDYVELRKWLINDLGLWAVVSLPAQIFQPYSGVKTSILLVDRALSRLTENIILVKIENDGFSLNTNRNPIKDNDLPVALNILTEYKKNLSVIPDEMRKLKHKILHRKDFAKLDSYKSTIAAIDFCKKEFNILIKAEEKYQKSIEIELRGKQKQKADERIKNIRQTFLINTGFNSIPPDENSIKQFVEDQLKGEIILYGENFEYYPNLSHNLKKYIDWQREYNLSIDKYFQSNEIQTRYESKRLDECIEEFNYPNKVQSRYYLEIGKYPIVDQSEKFIAGYTNDESYLINIYKPVIIFGDHTRIVKYIDFNFCLGADGVKVLVPTENLLSKYFYYVLRNVEVQNLGYSRHFKLLREKQIPLPPLEVQQKIVSEIEKYQKVVDGCNLVIQNYKPTFKIDESWEKVELNEIAEITSSKRIFQSEYISTGIPFYRTKEIVELNEGKEISLELFISRDRYEEIKNKFDIPQKGDLLISAVGTIGITWVIPDNREFYFKDGNLLWIKKLVNIEPTFLKLILDKIFNERKNEFINGAAYNALTIDKLKSILIVLPSLEEQQIIVDQIQSEMQAVEQCKRLKIQTEKKIKEVINSVWLSNSPEASK